MITPFELHRLIERAKDSGDEERRIILNEVLSSKNLAVIRRIPELLLPLSEEEKEMIAKWAQSITGGEDVSDRDFAFHLMVKCDVPAQRILGILEQNKTFSRGVLEHIQNVIGGEEAIRQFNTYLSDVAETLLKSEEIRPRDRGRHMFMTLANDEADWLILANRFSVEDSISDLRQGVIQRFLQECPMGEGKTFFIENVFNNCLKCIEAVEKRSGFDEEASHMHWALMCIDSMEDRDKKKHVRGLMIMLERKFGTGAVPRSVKRRIRSMLPNPLEGFLHR